MPSRCRHTLIYAWRPPPAGDSALHLTESRLPARSVPVRTRGLRVRCSAFPHVHQRPSTQVAVLRVPRWTVLDAGELQLKLQLRAVTEPAEEPERPLAQGLAAEQGGGDDREHHHDLDADDGRTEHGVEHSQGGGGTHRGSAGAHRPPGHPPQYHWGCADRRPGVIAIRDLCQGPAAQAFPGRRPPRAPFR